MAGKSEVQGAIQADLMARLDRGRTRPGRHLTPMAATQAIQTAQEQPVTRQALTAPMAGATAAGMAARQCRP